MWKGQKKVKRLKWSLLRVDVPLVIMVAQLTRVGDATWTFRQTEREPIKLQNIFIWKKKNVFLITMKLTIFSEKIMVLDIFLNNIFLAPALFDRSQLDSLNEGSWQGDSLALTEDEVVILMEEIKEEEDLKLLDVRWDFCTFDWSKRARLSLLSLWTWFLSLFAFLLEDKSFSSLKVVCWLRQNKRRWSVFLILLLSLQTLVHFYRKSEHLLDCNFPPYSIPGSGSTM